MNEAAGLDYLTGWAIVDTVPTRGSGRNARFKPTLQTKAAGLVQDLETLQRKAMSLSETMSCAA